MLHSILGARLRALAIGLLAALAVTAGLAIVPNDGWPHHVPGAPVQAHAAGGACGNWFDNPGSTYQDSYLAGTGDAFWDAWQGKWTHMKADLIVWRYTTTGSDGWPAGHCLSEIRGSGWVEDGSYGTDQLTWNFYRCGSNFESGGSGWNWEGAREQYSPWEDVSGCGLLKGIVTYTGHNASWTGWYPSNVPSAVADNR